MGEPDLPTRSVTPFGNHCLQYRLRASLKGGNGKGGIRICLPVHCSLHGRTGNALSHKCDIPSWLKDDQIACDNRLPVHCQRLWSMRHHTVIPVATQMSLRPVCLPGPLFNLPEDSRNLASRCYTKSSQRQHSIGIVEEEGAQQKELKGSQQRCLFSVLPSQVKWVDVMSLPPTHPPPPPKKKNYIAESQMGARQRG